MSLINGSSLDEPKQGSLVTKEQQQPEISTDARPKALFPYRLYELLESAKTDGFEDIISWLPCGTAFKIRNVEAFKDTILWRHFRLRNYKSFQRNVNLYEIKQGGGLGAMKCAYRHPHFIRGKEDLLKLMRRNVKSRSRKKQKQASIGLQPTIQEEATRFVSVNTSYHWTETQASVNSSSPCFNATQQNFHQWLSGSDDSLLHGCNQGMTTESSIVEAATTSSSNFISSYTSSTPSHYHHLLDTDDNAMLKSSQQDNSFKDDGNLLELEPIPGSNAHQINEDYSTDSAPSKNWVQMHDEALLQYSQSLVQAMADTTNLPPLVIDECDAFEAEKLPFRRDVGLEVIDTFTKDDIWDLLL